MNAVALPDRALRTPRLTCLAFSHALNAAELDTAVAPFARDACLITPDATAIRGREAIRLLLAQLIERHTKVKVELSTTIVAGPAAFVRERWRITSDGPAGACFDQASAPAFILRRLEEEGEAWKLQIAAPWGWGG